MKKSRSVEKLLGSYPPDVQALAQRARGLLLKLLPGVQEGASSSAPALAYGYGPGYRGMVCTLILSKSGGETRARSWSGTRGSKWPA